MVSCLLLFGRWDELYYVIWMPFTFTDTQHSKYLYPIKITHITIYLYISEPTPNTFAWVTSSSTSPVDPTTTTTPT